jgi:purine-nucleoside phosphorylase
VPAKRTSPGEEASLYERIQETSAALRPHLRGSRASGSSRHRSRQSGRADRGRRGAAVRVDPALRAVDGGKPAGNLVFGRLGGVDVVAMQGRVHFYEGYSMQQVTFPVRVLKALGIDSLVVSNAAGGMNPPYAPGDIVAITDHINLMGRTRSSGRTTSVSVNASRTCRSRMIVPTCGASRKSPSTCGWRCAAAFRGGRGSQPGDRGGVSFLRAIGADVVGMSLIPECIVAVHSGMRVLALTIVTDECLPDRLEKADVAKIIRTAAGAEPVLTRLVVEFLRRSQGA